MNEYKSFYKTVGGGEGSRCNYPTRLDVYGCGCAHDCSYCLSPDTRILMWDGKQKPISEVSVGDEIYGMDENRKLVRAVVLNKWGTRKPAYRITLRNGTVLVCSGDHRWLSNRGWKYTTDSDKGLNRSHLTNNNYIIGFRIEDYEPYAESELSNQVGFFEGHYLKSYDTSSRMIESIEPVGEMDLVDITTSTENFIAEGCVSHNCYAKSLLDFRGLWKPDDVAVADKAKVCRRLDRIPAGTILRLGGMTDPFQPIESRLRMNRWLIEELNKRGIGYLIVTKGASVADCLDVMDPELAHVQISYTYTEGLAPKGYEKASPPEARIESAERIKDGGIDVQLRLSPYIPEYVDQSRIIDCGVDRLLVEFLRINPFIEKSMRNLDPGFNLMPYMEKVGGYRHLPLEYKKQLLQPFVDAGKRVTVCEDHPEHYEWFKTNFNPNPDDCCDLRR